MTMYKNIENLYIRKNIFSVKYFDDGRTKEINLMFDDDYQFDTFDFEDFENFDYSNGYLRVVFENDFFYVKSNETLLVKIYAPKEVRKQIRKDINTMEYFDLNYRKHFRDKYEKTVKIVWVGEKNNLVYSKPKYAQILKRAYELSCGKKDYVSIILAETFGGIDYVVNDKKGDKIHAGTIHMGQ